MSPVVAEIRVTMLVAAVLLPLNAHADASALLARKGEHVAQTWCANCHAIGAPQGKVMSDAPTFASLARRPDLTDADIALGLLAPHPPMPNQNLTRDEVRAVTAYIRSLGPKDSGKAEDAR